MASNIEVSIPPNGSPWLTFYGNRDAAVANSGAYVWQTIEITSPPGHQIVAFPGYLNVEAKYMAGNTNRIVISGYVMDKTDAEAAIVASAKILLGLNKSNSLLKITIGGVSISSAGLARADTVICRALGEGTGPRWPFSLSFICLGGTD